MHPSNDILKKLVELRLNVDEERSARDHIQSCELCQEFCDYYHSLVDSIKQEVDAPLTADASRLANALYTGTYEGKLITLSPLAKESGYQYHRIAADSSSDHPNHDFSLATLFSENPDIILRIMRDPQEEHDYLHLVSEDESLVSGVLVQLPDLDTEFLTDQSGHAIIGTEPPGDYSELRWQIRMPHAVFLLEPLVEERDSVEFSKEITLQSESEDEVEVRFEKKGNAKQLIIRIIKLAGEAEFEHLKVAVSQKRSASLENVTSHSVVVFNVSDPEEKIMIRLFK